MLKQVSVYDKMTRSEREVADLLKEMGIKWSYERPIFVWDDNKGSWLSRALKRDWHGGMDDSKNSSAQHIR